jgi:hypothetical protein
MMPNATEEHPVSAHTRTTGFKGFGRIREDYHCQHDSANLKVERHCRLDQGCLQPCRCRFGKKGLVSASGGFTIARRCLDHSAGTCIAHATSISSFAESHLLRAESTSQGDRDPIAG